MSPTLTAQIVLYLADGEWTWEIQASNGYTLQQASGCKSLVLAATQAEKIFRVIFSPL